MSWRLLAVPASLCTCTWAHHQLILQHRIVELCILQPCMAAACPVTLHDDTLLCCTLLNTVCVLLQVLPGT
jgi:hypothetical protein